MVGGGVRSEHLHHQQRSGIRFACAAFDVGFDRAFVAHPSHSCRQLLGNWKVCGDYTSVARAETISVCLDAEILPGSLIVSRT